jgi:hypothetical protein
VTVVGAVGRVVMKATVWPLLYVRHGGGQLGPSQRVLETSSCGSRGRASILDALTGCAASTTTSSRDVVRRRIRLGVAWQIP